MKKFKWDSVETGYDGDDFMKNYISVMFKIRSNVILIKARHVSGDRYGQDIRVRLMMFKADRIARLIYSINEGFNYPYSPFKKYLDTSYINY